MKYPSISYSTLNEEEKKKILNSLTTSLSSLCSIGEYEMILNDLKNFIKNSHEFQLTQKSSQNTSVIAEIDQSQKQKISQKPKPKVLKMTKQEPSLSDISPHVVVNEILSFMVLGGDYFYEHSKCKISYEMFGYFKRDKSRHIWMIFRSFKTRLEGGSRMLVHPFKEQVNPTERLNHAIFLRLEYLKCFDYDYLYKVSEIVNVKFSCLEVLFLKYSMKTNTRSLKCDGGCDIVFSTFLNKNDFPSLTSLSLIHSFDRAEIEDPHIPFVVNKFSSKTFCSVKRLKIENRMEYVDQHEEFVNEHVFNEIFIHNKFENLKHLEIVTMNIKSTYKKWNKLPSLDTFITTDIDSFPSDFTAFQPLIFKNLKVLDFHNVIDPTMLRMLLNKECKLRKLDIITLNVGNEDFISCINCKEIRNLVLHEHTGEETKLTGKNFPRMEKLERVELRFLRKFEFNHAFVITNLAYLEIFFCDSIKDDFFSQGFKNLRHLEIVENTKLTGKKWGELCSLEILVLEYLNNFEDTLFQENKFVSKLKYLKIIECENLYGKGWNQLYSLKDLIFKIEKNMINEFTFFIEQNLNNIKKIDFRMDVRSFEIRNVKINVEKWKINQRLNSIYRNDAFILNEVNEIKNYYKEIIKKISSISEYFENSLHLFDFKKSGFIFNTYEKENSLYVCKRIEHISKYFKKNDNHEILGIKSNCVIDMKDICDFWDFFRTKNTLFKDL